MMTGSTFEDVVVCLSLNKAEQPCQAAEVATSSRTESTDKLDAERERLVCAKANHRGSLANAIDDSVVLARLPHSALTYNRETLGFRMRPALSIMTAYFGSVKEKRWGGGLRD
jgi:hypothetical protein